MRVFLGLVGLLIGCSDAGEDVASVRLGGDGGASAPQSSPSDVTEPEATPSECPVCAPVEVECTPTLVKECPTCEACPGPAAPGTCPAAPECEATSCPACSECPVAPVEAGVAEPPVVVVHEFHGDACAECANDPLVSCYPSLSTDESPEGGCWRLNDVGGNGCRPATFISEDLLEAGYVAVIHVPDSRERFSKCPNDSEPEIPSECVCSELLCLCP